MSTVTKYLEDRDVAFTEYDHPRIETAILEAYMLGENPDQVAKTIVLDTNGRHVLAVIAASKRLDLHRVGQVLGDPHVKLATESEIAKDVPGFDLGATPPLPALVGIPVIMDADLARHDTIVFASGRQTASVKIRSTDLLNDLFVTVAPLCKQETFDEDWME